MLGAKSGVVYFKVLVLSFVVAELTLVNTNVWGRVYWATLHPKTNVRSLAF